MSRNEQERDLVPRIVKEIKNDEILALAYGKDAANEMAKSPEGAKKHFIPEDERILQATKLLDPHSSETLRFLAPGKPGIYPYLCTFPGHWVLMKGEMIVK